MTNPLRVVAPKNRNPKLVSILNSFYSTYKGVAKDDKIHFDFTEVKWCCPLLLLPLAAHISQTGSTYDGDGIAISGYLQTIKFPGGVSVISELEKRVQSEKTFIPLTLLKRDAGVDRDRLSSLFIELVIKGLGNVEGAKSAIHLPINELVDNIFQHSGEEEGYLFGQYYPTNGYLDICIVDRGRGLQRTYKEEKGLDFTAVEAISAAVNGNSTKRLKERGFGLWSSRNIVCKALKGEFVYITGNAVLYKDGDKEDVLAELPGFNWDGVIVAYRIPQIMGKIDITPFLE